MFVPPHTKHELPTPTSAPPAKRTNRTASPSSWNDASGIDSLSATQNTNSTKHPTTPTKTIVHVEALFSPQTQTIMCHL